MLSVALFAKRTESMDNIKTILVNEVTKYAKRGVPINVEYVEDRPVVFVVGQIPESDGTIKVTEALYLGESADGAEEHPTVMLQQEYQSTKVIGQLIVIHMYEGVLLAREYSVKVGGELKADGGSLKVLVVGRNYAKIKDAVESAKQGVQQPQRAQTYYMI